MLASLTLLDISTTFIQMGPGFKAFLARHHGVRHIIIDRTKLFTFPAEVAQLGKITSAIGLLRAAEAHKAWRALSQRKSEALAAVQRLYQGTQHSNASRRRRRNSLSESVSTMSISTDDQLSQYDNVPSRFILLPPASLFESICYGIDAPTSEIDEWHESFQRGYQEGLAAVRESIDDKIGQIRRAEHKREMYPEGDGVFLRFASRAEREQFGDLSHLKDPFEILCHKFSLVRATLQDVHDLRLQLAESCCVFCTTADCPAMGGVAVSPCSRLFCFGCGLRCTSVGGSELCWRLESSTEVGS